MSCKQRCILGNEIDRNFTIDLILGLFNTITHDKKKLIMLLS